MFKSFILLSFKIRTDRYLRSNNVSGRLAILFCDADKYSSFVKEPIFSGKETR